MNEAGGVGDQKRNFFFLPKAERDTFKKVCLCQNTERDYFCRKRVFWQGINAYLGQKLEGFSYQNRLFLPNFCLNVWPKIHQNCLLVAHRPLSVMSKEWWFHPLYQWQSKLTDGRAVQQSGPPQRLGSPLSNIPFWVIIIYQPKVGGFCFSVGLLKALIKEINLRRVCLCCSLFSSATNYQFLPDSLRTLIY